MAVQSVNLVAVMFKVFPIPAGLCKGFPGPPSVYLPCGAGHMYRICVVRCLILLATPIHPLDSHYKVMGSREEREERERREGIERRLPSRTESILATLVSFIM